MAYDLTYQSATAPTDGPEPGTIALTRYVLKRWPAKTRTMGVYNRRRIRGISRRWSIHAEGRAWDCGISPKKDPVGLEIAEWLIEHAGELGIQYLIWNRRSWKAVGRKTPWRRYLGVSPHTDHVHIEQTREAAAQLTLEDIQALEKTVEPTPNEQDFVTVIPDEWGKPEIPGRRSYWAVYSTGQVVRHNGARSMFDLTGIPNHPIVGAFADGFNLTLVSNADSGTFTLTEQT